MIPSVGRVLFTGREKDTSKQRDFFEDEEIPDEVFENAMESMTNGNFGQKQNGKILTYFHVGFESKTISVFYVKEEDRTRQTFTEIFKADEVFYQLSPARRGELVDLCLLFCCLAG